MKTSRKKKPASRKRAAASTSARATQALREAWAQALKGLGRTQAQLEKRLRAALKRRGITSKEVGDALQDLGRRLETEGQKAVKQVEARLGAVQARLAKEGKALSRAVDDAVRRGLATLNIPSRQEVVELTRKVDELSRKLDRPRGRGRRSA
jgi:hypothetical protein